MTRRTDPKCLASQSTHCVCPVFDLHMAYRNVGGDHCIFRICNDQLLQFDRESRADIQFADHGQCPAHCFNNSPADGESQPRTLRATRWPSFHLHERLENGLLLVRRNADARVGDVNSQTSANLRRV